MQANGPFYSYNKFQMETEKPRRHFLLGKIALADAWRFTPAGEGGWEWEGVGEGEGSNLRFCCFLLNDVCFSYWALLERLSR